MLVSEPIASFEDFGEIMQCWQNFYSQVVFSGGARALCILPSTPKAKGPVINYREGGGLQNGKIVGPKLVVHLLPSRQDITCFATLQHGQNPKSHIYHISHSTRLSIAKASQDIHVQFILCLYVCDRDWFKAKRQTSSPMV